MPYAPYGIVVSQPGSAGHTAALGLDGQLFVPSRRFALCISVVTCTRCHQDQPGHATRDVGVGAKYVRLYAQDQSPLLYVDRSRVAAGKLNRGSQGNISSVNVEAPDLKMHPAFTTARFTHAVLLPGDMLFMPARCWHYVRALSTSISVNFWF